MKKKNNLKPSPLCCTVHKGARTRSAGLKGQPIDSKHGRVVVISGQVNDLPSLDRFRDRLGYNGDLGYRNKGGLGLRYRLRDRYKGGFEFRYRLGYNGDLRYRLR